MEGMYNGWQAVPFIQLFALEKLVPWEAEYGEVGREYRHGGECSLFEDRTSPGEEGWGSLNKIRSQVTTIPVAWPCSGIGNAMIPAHSPSMAHACVQSSGVLALHPIKGVRTSPPLIASAGSSGTAVVARKLARLLRRTMNHSSAVLLFTGWTMRRALGAGASLAEEPAVSLGCMLASGVSWSMSTSVVVI